MTQTPSKFTLNSDYLSIAQAGHNTYTVTVGGGSLVQGGYTEQNFDFTTSTQQGAISRILISKDGGGYFCGSRMTLTPTWSGDFSNNITGFINVFRTSSTNLRAQLVLQNVGSGTSTYPGMTFTIKVCSFRPPNVF